MIRNRIRVCLLAFAAAGLLAAGAGADDRDFVRKSVEDPYVFVLFDVSGSMNWTTKCTAADLTANKCRQLCNTQDCFAPLNADDPASKFYQAKEALYSVLQSVDNINFGFATYNQDGLNVASKHWLYKVTSAGVTLQDNSVYPPLDTVPATSKACVGAGASCDVFGRLWDCRQNSDVGCFIANNTNSDPADLGNAWESQRVRRLPKLGDGNNQNQTFYIRTGGVMYEVLYQPVAGETLGNSTMRVDVQIDRCTSLRPSSCTTSQGSATVTFELVDEFLSWDNGVETDEAQRGFFSQISGSNPPGHIAADAAGLISPSNSTTCEGWDPNAWPSPPAGTYENTGDDPFGGYNLRFPTTNTGDTRGKWFYRGDVLPLDWKNDNKADLLRRLAPVAGDYSQASYFRDHPQGGESFLRLLDESNRPLLAFGSTPLGASIQSFRTWWAGCPQGTCPKNSGWKDVAAAQDPNWGCRKKYLIVLTDGDETCGGGNSACNGTASLNAQEGIKTYVVAFGVPGGGTTLTCMANNGGTGSPIFPQNKQELVDALTKIFTEVKEEARAFASAAVPSVEANVKDKIFLSDFTPLTDESVWDGHLDAFLKPLPTLVDGTPNRTIKCNATTTSGCHLWDVGEVLKPRAPTPTDVTNGILRLGPSPINQRRVFYALETTALRKFQPPGTNPNWFDLFRGFGFANAAATEPDGVTPLAANRTRAKNIIGETLVLKTATVNTPGGSSFTINYVLGDIFHSDPLVLESPSNFNDFASNLFGDVGRPCDLTSSSDRGYKCYAFKHQHRRKLLMVGANDGQLHAFDTGVFDKNTELYGNGTGIEAFSVIPRLTLPVVRDQAEGQQQIFGVDGAASAGDVYFYGDGEWHSVVMIGTREGGLKLGGGRTLTPESGSGAEPMRGGYFALDVTQPDELETRTGPGGAITDFVPKVATGASSASPPPATAIPGCLDDNGGTQAGCPRPFPQLLWEFSDRNPSVPVATAQPLDEDRNGDGDLGEPWSKPILTRVKVLERDSSGNETTVLKFVAIIGGGLDASAKVDENPSVGNWIYMVEVETGQAIYKREVSGSVPSVSAIDTNSDNVADFMYFGTTTGRVYKVDLRTPQLLETVTVEDRKGNAVDVQRITGAAWEPLHVFTTGTFPQPLDYAPPPVYLPIQLIFIARLGGYALAIPTGDRKDLWNFDNHEGRLYVLVDQDWSPATPGLPLNETNFKRLLPTDANFGMTTNILLDPSSVGASKPGWYLFLDADERIITKPFAVSNILIFSSFQPQVIIDVEGGGGNAETFCSRTGVSRNFVVLTTNGNAIADLDPNDPGVPPGPGGPAGAERSVSIADFVTNPFVEQTQTQNVTGSAGPPTAEMCSTDPRLANIVNFLKTIGPSNARYGNYYLRLGQRESKRGIFYPACVPIGVVQANWKEN